MKLSKVIKEGLKAKRARNKGGQKKNRERKTTGGITASSLKPESFPTSATDTSPAKDVKPAAQASPAETLVRPSPKVKKKDGTESPISLITEEIESLELTTDEEEKAYRIGNLATLNFKDMEGCNPVMATVKVKEAVKESLIKKYDMEPEELEKKLEDFKKKFRAFGTHCYIHALKEKM